MMIIDKMFTPKLSDLLNEFHKKVHRLDPKTGFVRPRFHS